MESKLTHGELFAGISGFGKGFDDAGMQTIWHVENDKFCNNVIRKHYPDNLILGDIRDCGKHNLDYVDVISFGSPCQGLSNAGKRKGLNDERSYLFFEATRIVSELQPAFAIWENVPGAFSSNDGRDFYAVVNAFRQCGARDIAWRTFNAQYFGVAQRRRRVFLVADFRGERAGEILFEQESCTWYSKKGERAGQDITENTTSRALTSSRTTGRLDPYGETFITSIDVRNLKENSDIVGTLQAKNSGGYSLNYESVLAFSYQSADQTWLSPSSDKANTLSACQNQAIAYPIKTGNQISDSQGYPRNIIQDRYAVRRLTPTEKERLQGFEDGWTAGNSDSARGRMLGKAVCVNVIRWLGKRIVDISKRTKSNIKEQRIE